MSESNDPYGPHRQFIKRLSEESDLSEKLRRMPNRQLAGQLYRIAEEEPHYTLVCMEAAERLVPEVELITEREAQEN